MGFMRFLFVALAASFLLSACGGTEKKLKAAEAAYRQGDYKTAVETFQPLAEKGNARAQFFLGEMYLNGSGVQQDNAQALKWATAAAEQKDSDAQYALGGIYESGKGAPQDYVQAHMWYSLSATSGDEQAIRKKAELEIKKMSAPQIEQSVQAEIAWAEAHKH